MNTIYSKNPTQEERSTATGLASTVKTDETPAGSTDPITADEWTDDFDDFNPDSYRNAFIDLHDDSALGDQQLKSAYYYDGEKFVSIQVIIDSNSGECQLILPMDHPHYLGVPEEVPIFETKSVSVEELKS